MYMLRNGMLNLLTFDKILHPSLKHIQFIKTEVNLFMYYGQEKNFPSFEVCIGQCPGLCTLFFKTSTCFKS